MYQSGVLLSPGRKYIKNTFVNMSLYSMNMVNSQ